MLIKTNKSFVFLLIFALMFIWNFELESKPKSNKNNVTVKNKKTTKKTSKAVKSNKSKKQISKVSTKSNKNSKNLAKSKSTKKKKIARVKRVKYPAMTIAKDYILANGLHYQHLYIGNGYNRFSAHVLSTELNDENKAIVLKGYDHIDDLEKLHDMVTRIDTTDIYKIYGAVNANFWRAYSNLPIGPTVQNGEIIEMKSYKEWSSALWDDNQIVIDNFVINGLVQNKFGQWREISCVNHRRDSTGIVFYNKFGGDTIPYLSAKEFENSLLQIKKEILNETYADSLETDSTELEFDIRKLQQELIDSKRFEKIEYTMNKLRLIPIDEPALNHDIRYIVKGKDSTLSIRPQKGAILSLGTDFNSEEFRYKIGDTLVVSFNTTTHSDRKFLNGVCGTPRLVRNGQAGHEAQREGSRGRRFISKPLPRTALGTDKSGKNIYIVAIEPSSSSEGVIGANLTSLSSIMKKIGCYNAMNLDGGGSTVMVVDGKNVTRKGRPDYSRKISVGIGIGKKKKDITFSK